MSKGNGRELIFRVQRYDPEKDRKPHLQEFAVPWTQGMTVLNGLLHIKENIDSTLTFRTSCRMGICGSCGMMMNNYPHLACHTQIEEFHASKLTLKPLPNLPIVKDLVVDLTPMFNKHKAVKPYIIRQDTEEMANPTAEYSQMPEELNAFLQFSYCIKCGICVAACPTSASDKHFLGPQALAQCYHYCADSRDGGQLERFPAAGTDHGVWHCHLAGACSEACPKGVDPALAIQLMKRRLTAAALGLGKKQAPAALVTPPSESKPKITVPEFTARKIA
ncbi:MAG: succinate dehydrogenase iron-sulfur subunit [Chloroflexi bacterium]|nr:succinate dehydrogenase iron-sulfur subunit [Chloroflexota bacterium]